MDRDKLIEAIRLAIARVLDLKTDRKELELLADHLIANNIGDITEWKHSADVAEEALKMACKEVATINYGTLAFKINIIDTIVQDAMKKCKQQAEERLKERV